MGVEERQEVMSKAISNKNVLSAQFAVLPFDGAWKASFGCPELRGTWIVYGGSGSGKTTFVMQLCKYLSRFGRVAYNSLEQGLSLSLKKAWERVGMEDAGSRIVLLEKESLRDLTARLKKRQSADVIVIDSLHYWFRFNMADYLKLKNTFADKLFVYVTHEKGGQPKGTMAQNIRYDADVKVRVEGYKAFVSTRYEVPERGEGGKDYVVWAEGARKYWAEL